LFTGDPGLRGEDRNGDQNLGGNKSGTYAFSEVSQTDPDKYRQGIVYLEFAGIQIGKNSEGVRHHIQNIAAHNVLQKGDAAWFKRLDDIHRPKLYYNFGSFNGNGLW
jgi:hypothetical protein